MVCGGYLHRERDPEPRDEPDEMQGVPEAEEAPSRKKQRVGIEIQERPFRGVAATESDVNNESTFWVLNHQCFLRELEKLALESYVAGRINPAAGILARCIMRHTEFDKETGRSRGRHIDLSKPVVVPSLCNLSVSRASPHACGAQVSSSMSCSARPNNT